MGLVVSQFAPRVERLGASLLQRRKAIQTQHGWAIEDGRLSVFSKFFHVTVSTWIGLQYYEREILAGPQLNEAWWRKMATLPDEIPPDTMRDLAIYTFGFNGFLRNGFQAGLFSDVTESSLRAYLKAMNPVSYNKLTLYRVHRHIVEDLNLPQYAPLFKLLRLMRNGIHNNGVFMPDDQKDDTVEYKGRRYHFIVGDSHPYASWDDLLFFAEECVELLADVVQAQPLVGLPFVVEPLTQSSTYLSTAVGRLGSA